MSHQKLALIASLLCAAAPCMAADDTSTAVPAVSTVATTSPNVEPTPPKLVFTYPCTFSYRDGRLYETRVMDFECDYMHASLKDAARRFNAMPTLKAQQAFLDYVLPTADAAHNNYIETIAALIAATDPSKLPKNLPQTERLQQMAVLNVELSRGVFAAAAPFLWPPREDESYIRQTVGEWPSSWRPYIQPIYERSHELAEMVHTSEMKLIDKASADLEKTLRAQRLTNALKNAKTPGGGAALGSVFDGNITRGSILVPDAASTFKNEKKSGYTSHPISMPVSDLKVAPPPAPLPETDGARTQRNYFARGVTAGMTRLKDDATIALWHACDHTATIGNPYTKAALIFHQKGESCAVASQTEALRARGENMTVDQLAREGYDKGYFVDYETSSGHLDGGTSWQHDNSLLKDHGVNSTLVTNATPRGLDRAIRSSPGHDAIVFVKPRIFWNDPAIPDGAKHAVYLTGEEVESNGKVRGYYVNDTGTGEAARFVSAADFDKAWLQRMVSFDPPNPP